MTVYVSDAHALIWRLIASGRLSSAANDAFDRLIAAEALSKDAALISRDVTLAAVEGLRVVWEIR